MKFGMPTLVECADVLECRDIAVKYGLDFIELNMSFPQYQPSSLNVKKLLEIKERDGIFFTIHADEMLNPFDFNDKVSACYFDTMKDTISLSKQISAPIINMHLLRGVYVTLPDKIVLLNNVYFDNYKEKVRQFIKMCENEIGDFDIKIAIENVDSNPFTESQLRLMDSFMSSSAFALTLDTGHELCLGYKDSDVYEKYADKLVHMHLHDAKGKSAHLPLGSGEVRITDKISSLKNGNTCLVEVKTVKGLAESVEYLKNNKFLM